MGPCYLPIWTRDKFFSGRPDGETSPLNVLSQKKVNKPTRALSLLAFFPSELGLEICLQVSSVRGDLPHGLHSLATDAMTGRKLVLSL